MSCLFLLVLVDPGSAVPQLLDALSSTDKYAHNFFTAICFTLLPSSVLHSGVPFSREGMAVVLASSMQPHPEKFFLVIFLVKGWCSVITRITLVVNLLLKKLCSCLLGKAGVCVYCVL